VGKKGVEGCVRGKPLYLLFTVFVSGMVSGMVTLAVELSASRLLDPYFGTSNVVWANLIGLILAYLTVGYFVGGRLADRYPRPEVLYGITGTAGVLVGLVPFVARPVLLLASRGFARLFYWSIAPVCLASDSPGFRLPVRHPLGHAGRALGG